MKKENRCSEALREAGVHVICIYDCRLDRELEHSLCCIVLPGNLTRSNGSTARCKAGNFGATVGRGTACAGNDASKTWSHRCHLIHQNQHHHVGNMPFCDDRSLCLSVSLTLSLSLSLSFWDIRNKQTMHDEIAARGLHNRFFFL